MAPRKTMRIRRKTMRSKSKSMRTKTVKRGGGFDSLKKLIEERSEKGKDSLSFLVPDLKDYFCESPEVESGVVGAAPLVVPRFKAIIDKFKGVMLKSKKTYGGETAKERLDTIKNSLFTSIEPAQISLNTGCDMDTLADIGKRVNINRNITSFKNKQSHRFASIKRKPTKKSMSIESICCTIEFLDTNLSTLTAQEERIKKYAYHLIALIALKELYADIGMEDETVWTQEEQPSLSRSDSIRSSTSAGGSKKRKHR
jgi:hypothetical protein